MRIQTIVLGGVVAVFSACVDMGPEHETFAVSILYNHRNLATSTGELHILEPSGTDRLLVDSSGSNNYASWSPDGNMIVFRGNRGHPTEIYVVYANGLGERNISNYLDFDQYPEWSPDGRYILFQRYFDVGTRLIVTDTTGLNQFDLTPFQGHNSDGCWSPDGQLIAYRGDQSGNGEIFVTDAGGKDHKNMTNTPDENEYAPAWSPTGQAIAFASRGQLYIMSALVSPPYGRPTDAISSLKHEEMRFTGYALTDWRFSILQTTPPGTEDPTGRRTGSG
jgi:Tol biopolymer transport system component